MSTEWDMEPSRDQAADDSGILEQIPLPNPSGVLKVYQTGEITVVGFGGEDVPSEICIAGYRDQLAQLLEAHRCRVLAFDLSGGNYHAQWHVRAFDIATETCRKNRTVQPLPLCTRNTGSD